MDKSQKLRSYLTLHGHGSSHSRTSKPRLILRCLWPVALITLILHHAASAIEPTLIFGVISVRCCRLVLMSTIALRHRPRNPYALALSYWIGYEVIHAARGGKLERKRIPSRPVTLRNHRPFTTFHLPLLYLASSIISRFISDRSLRNMHLMDMECIQPCRDIWASVRYD